MKIFLVGFMGCGKTSMGRKLASMLGWRFADTDREIEERCGAKVSEVFARHGEDYFREREQEILLELSAGGDNLVVSTGGGAPCHGDNMEVMNRAGRTIYLRMSPEKLVARLEHGREKRPKIKDMDDAQLLAFIREVLPAREVCYEKAHLVIDCDGASDQYVCNHIIQYIKDGK